MFIYNEWLFIVLLFSSILVNDGFAMDGFYYEEDGEIFDEMDMWICYVCEQGMAEEVMREWQTKSYQHMWRKSERKEKIFIQHHKDFMTKQKHLI